jgi:hypothetical protein
MNHSQVGGLWHCFTHTNGFEPSNFKTCELAFSLFPREVGKPTIAREFLLIQNWFLSMGTFHHSRNQHFSSVNHQTKQAIP